MGVVGLVLVMRGVSFVLGGRHSERVTGEPYESGMIPVGSARLRFPARYYLLAFFFVIFDLEVVYLFAWGVAAREAGWLGYLEAMVFLGVLTLGLVYIWRIGALDWTPERSRRPSKNTPIRSARKPDDAARLTGRRAAG
ncbi:MAG: NADH-quinone oxidoreductase subunit A [Salinisphaera sp.]|nr:NADH-quinone oxidoreductase subunit A [Salinisphaera sp.]